LVALEEFYAEKLVIKNNQPEPVVVETPKPSTDTEASAETDVETDVETETRA